MTQTNTPPLSLKVSREECSENAWALLGSRAETIQQLRTDLVKAYKRLCKYEGHLIITAPDGKHYCELCEEEVYFND